MVDLESIWDSRAEHSRSSEWWQSNSVVLDKEIRSSLTDGTLSLQLGEVAFDIPYVSFGNVDLIDILGLDELILFSLYNVAGKLGLYESAADLGANIGLHSAVLASFGYSVTAFEPDPIHSQFALKFLRTNRLDGAVEWNEKAVVPPALAGGKVVFKRIEGNTTSSHVKGAKRNAYGAFTEFQVSGVDFLTICQSNDLLKIDVEGFEADLLTSLVQIKAPKADFIVEIGSIENRQRIFGVAKELGLSIYSQKLNWQRCTQESDLPATYKEGSVFICSDSDRAQALFG